MRIFETYEVNFFSNVKIVIYFIFEQSFKDLFFFQSKPQFTFKIINWILLVPLNFPNYPYMYSLFLSYLTVRVF